MSAKTPATRILGMATYAKSSKVLYVAHDRGVSRTGDGGVGWTTATPPGFTTAPKDFVALLVNPVDRKEAVLVLSQQAWATTDYGLRWQRLRCPETFSTIYGAAFGGEGHPWLSLVAREGVYHSANLGKSWVCSLEDIGDSARLSASRNLQLLMGTGYSPRRR